ncbi:MAG: TetR/AcrR family transcriptional regulator [Myxococcales bacterium]|nr:TetR/AcrR family transcriptional regulator [Myxococcales bacterium]
MDAICTATAQVLLAEGYDGVTTNRVAERAGVSIGTLYQYFGNKEALIGGLVDREFDRFFERLVTYLELPIDTSVEATVTAYVRATLKVHLEHAALYQALAEQLRAAGWHALEALWQGRCIELVELSLTARPALIGGRDPGPVAFALTHAVHAVLLHAALDRPALLASAGFADSVVALIVGCLQGSAGPATP